MSSLSMLEFLSWISIRPRTYEEAMEAWRSTCPRHSVWEDAVIDGLIQMGSRSATNAEVTLSPKGRAILDGKCEQLPREAISGAHEVLEEHRGGETRPLDELIG